jgi:hypothetical protein
LARSINVAGSGIKPGFQPMVDPVNMESYSIVGEYAHLDQYRLMLEVVVEVSSPP